MNTLSALYPIISITLSIIFIIYNLNNFINHGRKNLAVITILVLATVNILLNLANMYSRVSIVVIGGTSI